MREKERMKEKERERKRERDGYMRKEGVRIQNPSKRVDAYRDCERETGEYEIKIQNRVRRLITKESIILKSIKIRTTLNQVFC